MAVTRLDAALELTRFEGIIPDLPPEVYDRDYRELFESAGIHDHDTFEMACSQANGAIIGTAFIRYLKANLNPQDQEQLTKKVRQQKINILCENFINRIRG